MPAPAPPALQLQLRQGTYSPEALAALRAAAAEVDQQLAGAQAEVQQVRGCSRVVGRGKGASQQRGGSLRRHGPLLRHRRAPLCLPAPRLAPWRQAQLRLAAYRSLGPPFEALAAEHGGLLEALGEAEYELREVEQFRQLAALLPG